MSFLKQIIFPMAKACYLDEFKTFLLPIMVLPIPVSCLNLAELKIQTSFCKKDISHRTTNAFFIEQMSASNLRFVHETLALRPQQTSWHCY